MTATRSWEAGDGTLVEAQFQDALRHKNPGGVTNNAASRRFFMSANSNHSSAAPSFVSCVFSNDATKRGIASAVVGVLVAVATEALFPRP